MYDTKKAERMLELIFPVSVKAVDYIAPYKTSTGKEFALERKARKSDSLPYYVWMQHEPPRVDGASIRNLKNPGKPYDALQRRTTGLSGKTAPALMNGKVAYYVKVRDIVVLQKLAEMYESTSISGKIL